MQYSIALLMEAFAVDAYLSTRLFLFKERTDAVGAG
jgi:hypothetical protein